MKNVLFVFFLVFVTACTEVYFTETQPAGKKPLNEIPVSFQGWFVEKNGSDSVHVSFRGFDINDDSAILSDSVVLTKWKKNYFLNTLEKSKGYWEVYLIRMLNENEIELLIIDGDDDNTVKDLEKYTTVTSQNTPEGKIDYYLISPSSKSFKGMVKDGVFKPSVIYTRINQ
jgi:hypothetical protein